MRARVVPGRGITGDMIVNPLLGLAGHGQSVWLDFIDRRFVRAGGLARLIRHDGLRGLTSNPAIFDRAISDTDQYDDAIAEAVDADPRTIYERLAVNDIRRAADLFQPVYEQTRGQDGYVSLEVSPHLARDTAGTVSRARMLWRAVDRPNCCIKVPATREGLPAIRRLIGEGINVNVTLIFAVQRYREVAAAYLDGLDERVARGQPIDGIASFASFFLSRIDVAIDPLIDRLTASETGRAATAALARGQVAIALAKVAYGAFKDLQATARAHRLRTAGAMPQRLLWASTGTKRADESDVKYIEPLIGPETVTTMPPRTLSAYRDHGHPAPRLQEDVGGAHARLALLANAGIDLDTVTERLEDEGLDKFNRPFDHLLGTIADKRPRLHGR